MQRRKRQRGLSLLEVIVTLSIVLIVLPATMSFLVSSYRSFYSVDSRSSVQSTTRQMIDTMTRGLRQATSGDNGAYAIIDVQAQSVTFYANVDADPDTERIRYFLDGEEMKSGVIKPTGDPPQYTSPETITTIGQYIVNGADPTFLYYDNTYTGTEDPLEGDVNEAIVRYIRITLLADDNVNRAPEALTVGSGVHIRNLKDNY